EPVTRASFALSPRFISVFSDDSPPESTLAARASKSAMRGRRPAHSRHDHQPPRPASITKLTGVAERNARRPRAHVRRRRLARESRRADRVSYPRRRRRRRSQATHPDSRYRSHPPPRHGPATAELRAALQGGWLPRCAREQASGRERLRQRRRKPRTAI